MFKYVISALLFVGLYANAAPYISDGVVRGGGQAPVQKNFAPNPFAEKNVLGWTASGSMVATRDTDAADKLNAVASFELNPSAAETFTSSAMTTDNDIVGNCEAQVLYKGNASTWDFALLDGSNNVLTEVSLTDTTTWTQAAFNYPCASGYRLQMQSDDGVNTINVGNFYWGKATNITSATPIYSSTYTPLITNGGNGTATGSFTREGQYIVGEAKFTAGSTTPTGVVYMTLPQGLTANTSLMSSFTGGYYVASSDGYALIAGGAVNLMISYEASSNKIHAYIVGDRGTSNIGGGGLGSDVAMANGNIAVFRYRIPILEWASSQTAVTVENTDTEWGACSSNPTIGGTATCTISFISCLWRREGDSIHTRVNASVGAAACTGTSNVTVTAPNGLSIDLATKLVSRTVVGAWSNASTGRNGTLVNDHTATSFGINGLGAAWVSSDIGANNNFALDYVLPISGWTKTASAPLLVGSVTSNSSGLERVVRVAFSGNSSWTASCSSTPCTVNSTDNSVTGVTKGITGSYTVTFAAGVFSSAPVCTGSGIEFAVGYRSLVQDFGASNSTTAALVCANGNTMTNCAGTVLCMGPR